MFFCKKLAKTPFTFEPKGDAENLFRVGLIKIIEK